MARWADTEIHIIPEQTPFDMGILQGTIAWFKSAHQDQLPMAVRLIPAHYVKVMLSLRNGCERKYGVPILPEGGFHFED